MDAEGAHETCDVVPHRRFRQRQHSGDLWGRATASKHAKDFVLPSRQRIFAGRAGLGRLYLRDTEDPDDAAPVIERDAVNLDGNLLAAEA